MYIINIDLATYRGITDLLLNSLRNLVVNW